MSGLSRRHSSINFGTCRALIADQMGDKAFFPIGEARSARGGDAPEYDIKS